MSLPGNTVIQPASTLSSVAQGAAPVTSASLAPLAPVIQPTSTLASAAPITSAPLAPVVPTQLPINSPFSQQQYYNPPLQISTVEKNKGDGILKWFFIILIVLVVLAFIAYIVYKQFFEKKQTSGSSCTSSSDCIDNLVCQNLTCRKQTGGTCINDNECLSGDGCIRFRCTTVTDANKGDSCNTTDKPCKTGLTCENSVCKSSLGSACTSVMSDCVSQATGCSGGICISASTGAFTGPCRQSSPGSVVTACNSGLVCESSTNRCLLGPGSGCEVDDDCANGAFCSNNICAFVPIQPSSMI